MSLEQEYSALIKLYAGLMVTALRAAHHFTVGYPIQTEAQIAHEKEQMEVIVQTLLATYGGQLINLETKRLQEVLNANRADR